MSNKLYTTIPAPKLKRNNFSLSFRNYLTMSQHKNVPTLIKEILPGDIFNVNLETFARVQPMIAPPMSSISVSHHVFYVPMRTLSKVWPDFITGGREGTNDKVLPYTTMYDLYTYISYHVTEADVNPQMVSMIKCLDYMGINFKYPTNEASVSAFLDDWVTINAVFGDSSNNQAQESVNLLPFVAVAKIYDEYYRDQNLEESVMDSIREFLPEDAYGYIELDPTSTDWHILFTLFDRAWKKDRFTSALPFTQRGPEVYIPLAGTAPVNVSNDGPSSGIENKGVYYSNTGDTPQLSTSPSYYPLNFVADLDNAELQTTINSFRQAERLQAWYERDARGGSRINENQLAHWGVSTPDATLDRAQFLGGEHFPIVVSEVEQNSASEEDGTVQGTLAGKASGYQNGGLFKKFFNEYGYVICLTSIMSQAVYSQGMDKMYFRRQRQEYAWPEFAHLGEEPIYNKEVNIFHSNPDGVFGYTPRYSDYKSALSQVHGDFKGNLHYWLQQRNLAQSVALNKDFVMSKPDDSIFAVDADLPVDQFLVVLNFGIRASRLLPFYGVPTL